MSENSELSCFCNHVRMSIPEGAVKTEHKSLRNAPPQNVAGIVRERLKNLQQDKKTASSWADVKRRILERRSES